MNPETVSPAAETIEARVLVVDDDTELLTALSQLLGAEGYHVTTAATAEDALDRFREETFHLVLTDLQLPGKNGIALIKAIGEASPATRSVLITGHGSIRSAVLALKRGATEYMTKPIKPKRLLALCAQLLTDLPAYLPNKLLAEGRADVARTGGLVARSRAMRAVFERIRVAAAAETSVLVVGESGTGKELLARTIHRMSLRRDMPFVAFDCSALAPSLIESELFGHEKGAFTGAARARRGLFREAHGGTLFLDEIGDIAPEVQNKLLRVLQEREIKPVGGDNFVKVDVRILAATNKDLKGLAGRGVFREDLYWRLAVVPLEVPPLRERREDLPLLCAHILARRRPAGSGQRFPVRVSASSLAKLAGYAWPGNIRELENVLARAALLCDGDEIRPDDLPPLDGVAAPSTGPQLADGRPLKDIVADAIRAVEKQAIRDALAKGEGSPARAARLLGISRASIYNKLKEYDIVP